MYTTLKEVTKTAEKLNFTVGAFNTHNLEMLPDMLRAAKEMGAPIIIQTSIDTAKYIGYSVLVHTIKAIADQEMVDAVLHLDHARDVDEIKAAIDAVVDVLLVIHGGTGVKEEDYPELINNGIRKFNVGTELLVNWTKLAKEAFGETEVNKSLRYNVIPANQIVKDIVKHKIQLFMNLEAPTNLSK